MVLIQSLRKTVAVSQKSKHTLVLHWTQHPQYLVKAVLIETCMWMFITALLVVTAKTWKQPTSLSVGEWINKLVHPDNGILLSTLKKIYQVTNTWRNNKCILLSRRSQSV